MKVSSKPRSGEENGKLGQRVRRGIPAAAVRRCLCPRPNPRHALAGALTLQAAEKQRVRVSHIEIVQQHEGAGAAGADAAESSQQQPAEGPGTDGDAGIHLHLPVREPRTWTPEASLADAQWPLVEAEYHLEVVRVLRDAGGPCRDRDGQRSRERRRKCPVGP